MRELKIMNKLEFLTRLRNSLEKGGLPAEDINDALTYYEEVFLDAGFGKEEETAASMGSPEDVAVNILRESGIHVNAAPVMPPQRTDIPQNDQETYQNSSSGTYQNSGSYQNGYVPPPAPQPKQRSVGATIALIILAVLTFPVWLPLLIVVVVLLFVLIVVLASLIFAAIATAVGLLIASVPAMFHSPSEGLMLLGGGLVFAGIVILIFKPAFNVVIPACGRLVKRFFSWLTGLFRKGGR